MISQDWEISRSYIQVVSSWIIHAHNSSLCPPASLSLVSHSSPWDCVQKERVQAEVQAALPPDHSADLVVLELSVVDKNAVWSLWEASAGDQAQIARVIKQDHLASVIKNYVPFEKELWGNTEL